MNKNESHIEGAGEDCGDRLYVAGQSLVVIDDFLRVGSVFLSNVQREYLAFRSGQFFWSGDGCSGHVEMLVALIARTVLFHEFVGADYWTNVFRPGHEEMHPLHDDRDEVIARLTQNRVVLYPRYSAVFFPVCHDIDGGEHWNNEMVIEPRFNRLIVFDGSKRHGSLPVQRGERHSIAINYWSVPNFSFFMHLLNRHIGAISFRPYK